MQKSFLYVFTNGKHRMDRGREIMSRCLVCDYETELDTLICENPRCLIIYKKRLAKQEQEAEN